MADQKKPNGQQGAKKKKKAADDPDIFTPPKILREPASRQVYLGQKIVLRVNATGMPLPSYQWYLNGKKISGANSDRYTVNKSRRQHAGAYTCVAKNFVGAVETRMAMITFLQEKLPDLLVEPRNAVIEAGKPFKLSVVGIDEKKLERVKLQWIFNGKRIVGALNSCLEFTQFKKKYEGEYKLMATLGSMVKSSNLVTLKLKVADGQQTASAPQAVDAVAPVQEPAAKNSVTAVPDASPVDPSALLSSPVEANPLLDSVGAIHITPFANPEIAAEAPAAAETTTPVVEEDPFFVPEEEELEEGEVSSDSEAANNEISSEAASETVAEEDLFFVPEEDVSYAGSEEDLVEPVSFSAKKSTKRKGTQSKKEFLEKLLSTWQKAPRKSSQDPFTIKRKKLFLEKLLSKISKEHKRAA